MKTRLVTIPSIADPIKRSPGFEKKELATHKLDIMGLCGFGCSYCSSNAGLYLQFNKRSFARATEEQLGEALLPATSPELSLPTPPSTNGHAAVAPMTSLTGLRKAARALRIDGDVVVTGRDDGATVTIGAESWPGADEDEAVASARRDLDGRLRQLRRQLEDALTSLGGAP